MKSTNRRAKKYFILPDVSMIPRKMHESCDIFGKWRLTDTLLGRGSYGQVSVACDDKSDCQYVAKQIQFDFSRYDQHWVFNMFFAESFITQYAGSHGFGIPVHAFFLCDGQSSSPDVESGWFGFTSSVEETGDAPKIRRGVIIMKKYDGDLESIRDELTWADMKTLLDKVTVMHEAGILHRDLFLKNTMYKNVDGGREIQIIDFGLSIAFERSIPKPLRAIDYINLISDIPNESLKGQCHKYIAEIIGSAPVKTGSKWLLEHFDKCSSEYSLLRYLPIKWIQMMGPGTIDTMVWSVRCNQDLDQDIVRRTTGRIKNILS